jgi:AcrR family transcriptional regulator
MAGAARNPRERYREQVREEIKAHAWTQVSTTGASALSLNAIAKQMGISGPALYRYFRNRDELITELVLDAYRDLTDACRSAARAQDSPAVRLTAVATAIRRWALAHPHRYLLIYGTPVPGYIAPPAATAIIESLMSIILDAFTDLTAPTNADSTRSGATAGAIRDAAAGLDAHLAADQQWAADHPATVRRRALSFWTRVHGVVSLEVAGHFTGMGFDPGLLYVAEVDAVVSTPG